MEVADALMATSWSEGLSTARIHPPRERSGAAVTTGTRPLKLACRRSLAVVTRDRRSRPSVRARTLWRLRHEASDGASGRGDPVEPMPQHRRHRLAEAGAHVARGMAVDGRELEFGDGRPRGARAQLVPDDHEGVGLLLRPGRRHFDERKQARAHPAKQWQVQEPELNRIDQLGGDTLGGLDVDVARDWARRLANPASVERPRRRVRRSARRSRRLLPR